MAEEGSVPTPSWLRFIATTVQSNLASSPQSSDPLSHRTPIFTRDDEQPTTVLSAKKGHGSRTIRRPLVGMLYGGLEWVLGLPRICQSLMVLHAEGRSVSHIGTPFDPSGVHSDRMGYADLDDSYAGGARVLCG